ncbi:MAG: hypothetical protein ACT4O1_00795 [Gemmatimonadota bacterium]
MSARTPQRKTAGPRYYRVPSFWGLIVTLVIVVLLIFGLLRLG